MGLAKYLSVSLIVLSAGAASAGEFYQNGPSATLTYSAIEQGPATQVNFPPATAALPASSPASSDQAQTDSLGSSASSTKPPVARRPTR